MASSFSVKHSLHKIATHRETSLDLVKLIQRETIISRETVKRIQRETLMHFAREAYLAFTESGAFLKCPIWANIGVKIELSIGH